MKITINGNEKDYASELSLKDLVAQASQSPGRVIAEVNGSIVKSEQWEKTSLQEGDVIELVTFVGGG